MHRFARTPLCSVLSFAATASGCGLFDTVGDPVRVGAAVGWTVTDLSEDLDDPEGDRTHDLAFDVGGFVEAGVEDAADGTLIVSRFLYADTEHGVDGFSDDARLQQVLVFGLYAPPLLHRGDLDLRPFLGLGFGAVAFDHPAIDGTYDSAGAALAVAAGLEVEAFDDFTFGFFGYAGTWGSPGDTSGYFSQGMVYVGVRF